ncbi:MAG: YbaK/EbsC family protein [Burkholderiaceae bacterium]|jgi:Cys-tRNA(Pro) deacylase
MATTPATRALERAGIGWREHRYDYVDHGGTTEASRQLGIDEHRIAKTLVMVDDRRRERLVVMHGDCTVALKQLAREVGCKTVTPAAPELAERVTGYRIGGISPFGTRKAMPVHVARGLLALETLLVNGGQRGFLIEIPPRVIVDLLAATAVDCALPVRDGAVR